MTKKIKTLGNNKDGNDWIASLSLAMTTTTKKHKLSQMTKNNRNDDNNNGLLRFRSQ